MLITLWCISGYTQSRKIDMGTFERKYSPYFINLDKNFYLGKFSFNNTYENYGDELQLIEDDSVILYFENTYQSSINDSNFVFEFRNYTNIEGISFDKCFLRFGEQADKKFYEEIVFLKKEQDTLSSNLFYKSALSILNKKFGTPNQWGKLSIWVGDNIYFKLSLFEDIVKIEIGSFIKNNYFKSLKFKYDYYCTSQLFKDMDNDYIFRGIKFETTFEKVKTLTKLTPALDRESKYFYYTNDPRFKKWNLIDFSEVTYFGFSNEKKLSEVVLINNFIDEESYINFKNDILEKLGSPSFQTEESYFWVGKKITIYLEKEFDPTENEKNYKSLKIVSNLVKTGIDKNY